MNRVTTSTKIAASITLFAALCLVLLAAASDLTPLNAGSAIVMLALVDRMVGMIWGSAR
jgi:hypothetical protein